MRILLLVFLVGGLPGHAQSAADEASGGNESCYRVYDEARPLFAEDFSLRMFRAGADIDEATRRDIARQVDQLRLAGTVLKGGSTSLRIYNDELTRKMAACDAALDIPATAIVKGPADNECARRYATMSVLARAPQQQMSFDQRMRLAVTVSRFRSGTETELEAVSLHDAQSFGVETANGFVDTKTDAGRDALLDMIFDVQACDAKYGHSLMLIPGTFSQMFGPPDRR